MYQKYMLDKTSMESETLASLTLEHLCEDYKVDDLHSVPRALALNSWHGSVMLLPVSDSIVGWEFKNWRI
jgi:hypothetical protein